MPVRLKPRQAVRPEMTVAPAREEGQALALAELARGLMVCCFRWGTEIRATASEDAGATWSESLAAATGVAEDAAPCLVVDPWDRLSLWYHDGAGVRARTTTDGKAWQEYAGPFAIGTHPAVALSPAGLRMACCSGGVLRILRSSDRGATWEAAGDVTALPAQRAALLVDRHGYLQLYTHNTGRRVEQRSSPDGVRWTDPRAVLAAGSYPAVAEWPAGRVLLCWAGDMMLYHTLAGDGVTPSAPLAAPSGLRAGYLGLIINRHGLAWMAGFEGNVMRRYCAHPGGAWRLVA